MTNPLETYLKELAEIRASGAGVVEASYYGPLANLLNEIGKNLKPKVKCIINLQDQGAGLPDGGFFTQDQFQKFTDAAPLAGQTPARGVMEVTKDDAWVTAASEQVTRYWGRYRQVLVTNYRDFVWVGQDPSLRISLCMPTRKIEKEEDIPCRNIWRRWLVWRLIWRKNFRPNLGGMWLGCYTTWVRANRISKFI
jgi:hypothetical protein